MARVCRVSDCGMRCFYCGCQLAGRHEHDHFPIPKKHGGKHTVPICINCHDLKDRTRLIDWEELYFQAFNELTPLGRLLLAKVYVIMLDVERGSDAS